MCVNADLKNCTGSAKSDRTDLRSYKPAAVCDRTVQLVFHMHSSSAVIAGKIPILLFI